MIVRRPSPDLGASASALKSRLDELYASFDHLDSATDPVHLVRPYQTSADREIVGFCAAALAFGRVASVLNSIGALQAVLGESPATFVRLFDPQRDGSRLTSFVHRWTRGDDLVALLWILRHMIEEAGSIEGFFLEGDDPAAPDIAPALESFSRRAREVDLRPAYGRRPRRPGVCYFFPRPSAGSGCKRLNLFLRWMVRRDAIDLGVWTRVSPARLVVPLDTHVVRVGRCLGLTRYRSPGWRMAAEITATLRELDPGDPVKYDFSLCHIGMMNACGFGKARGDRDCPLKGYCRSSPHR
jgi:uncharacterized protein (TIGR02757 family)